jgi:beta-barrel assembly-enhancing protease
MRLDWDAAYLDGRTAARRRATIHITRTGLDIVVADDGPRLFWPFREIRQTQGNYAGEQVRLERGGELPEALLIADAGFLSAARAVAPDAARLHEPARRRLRVGLTFGALLSAIALAVGIYYVGIPAFARVAAAHVPVSWEEKLGSAIVDHFAPPNRRCEDAPRQARLESIVARLTAKRPPPYAVRLTVVNSPIVNALAAPGGHILVFRGLLERTETAEELAGVLAHEIAHVEHRHVTRAIFQQASTGVLMAALAGDISGVVAFGLEGARTLGDLQMSRAAEIEADQEGMRRIQEARVDPAGTITFFEKLAKREREHNDSLARYLRTHPTTMERIASLRALAAMAPGPPERLLPDDDWNAVKSLCGELPAESRSPRR